MSWPSSPGSYGAAEPLFLLLAALALEAYLGGPWIRSRWYLQPRRPVSNLISELDRRLNRADRGRLDLLLRGAIVVAGLALAAYLLGRAVEWFLASYPFAWVFEVILLALIVAQRRTCVLAAEVSKALAGGSVIAAQEALRPLVLGRVAGDALGRLDQRGVISATIDGLARAFAVEVIAPVFWFILLGLPGVFLQQAIRTAAVYFSVRHATAGRGDASGGQDFAMTALRLDSALNLLPMLLADALLVVAAAFIPRCSPREAAQRAWDSRGHVSTTMGGALLLAPDNGSVGTKPHAVQLERIHIERAVAVFAVGCLLNAGLVAALAWMRVVQ